MKTPVFSTSDNGYTLILGLGETGLAAAHWYLRQQLPVRLADTRVSYQPQLEAVQAQYQTAAIEIVLGEQALASSVLDGVKTVVLSPGLALTDTAVAALLLEAKKQQIAVISEIELFAQALHDLIKQGYQTKVMAVTGTNGKTTVTQMLKHMVADANYRVQAAGNISPAALEALRQCLDANALPDFWIIELSSFQLEHTFSLPVLAGTVLNITQDHIDWHGSMALYAQAKARLFAMSTVAVVNRNDSYTQQLAAGHAQIRSFGLDSVIQAHDVGVVDQQGQSWICTKDTTASQVSCLLPTEALLVAGKHNLSNALAALTLAHAAGLEWASLLMTLRSYHGEPHRCQFVRNIAGVDFINDSKGTNVGATVAALEGLDRPLVLIVGGVDKGQSFEPLAQAITSSSCKAVVLIGRDASRIAQQLENTSVPLQFASDLDDAVSQSFALSVAGDAVLLSPACASFDMFSGYIERGHRFVESVTELALDQGEVA